MYLIFAYEENKSSGGAYDIVNTFGTLEESLMWIYERAYLDGEKFMLGVDRYNCVHIYDTTSDYIIWTQKNYIVL